MTPELTLDVPVINLDLHVPDIEKTMSLYDRMEVWRSNDNITYAEITDVTDLSASIDGTVVGTWNLNGTTLTIAKNSAAPISITFTSANPYDLQTVINIINPYFHNPLNPNYKIASQVPTVNRLRLTSDLDGLESNLLISGSAAAVLGLSTVKTYGKLHRIVLTMPTTRYRLYDTSAENQLYYYKTRFSSTKTGRLSTFSDYIPSKILPIIDDSNLVVCSARFSDNQGNPIKNKRIIITIQKPQAIGTSAPFIGVLEERIELLTDQFGFVSTKLPKNTTIKVYIENSYLNRIIDTGVVDFDLLDKLSTTPDPMTLEVAPNLAPIISMF